MARVGATKTISNFSKGWVTEYSPLDFPANSLAEALNIDIKRDGSIENRTPFSSKITDKNIAGFEPNKFYDHIKVFYFPNDMGIVIAYLKSSLIRLQFFHKYSSGAQFFQPEVGYEFFNLKDFDVTFLEDGLLIPLNEKRTSSPFTRDCQIYRLIIESNGNISISSRFEETNINIPITTPWYISHENALPPGGASSFTGIIWRQTVQGYSGSTDWDSFHLINLEISLYESGVRIGGPWADWPAGTKKTVLVNGQSRSYERGANTTTTVTGLPMFFPPLSTNPQGNIQDTTEFLLKARYTYNNTGIELSGKAGKVVYRDFFGMPNVLDNEEQELSETLRPYSVSAPMSYNLFNAGWRWGDSVNVSIDSGGSGVDTATGSLAYATKSKLGVWPSLSDSSERFKIDKASSVSALGLFSPHLMLAEAPSSGRVRRGTNLLQLTGEHKGKTNVPNLKSYFVPRLDTTVSTVYTQQSYTTVGNLDVSNLFFNKAQEIRNSSSIKAMSYINGRVWYGVEHPSFNLAFSQVEETPTKNFIETPDVQHLANCYQVTDPNDSEENQIVATDGGTMTLRDVGEIKKIIGFRHYILVFSANGVWAISGGNGEYFSPLSFNIDKVSTEGITNNQNVLETDNGIYYVSDTSIYFLTVDERGSLSSIDIANKTIKDGVRKVVKSFNANRYTAHSMSYDPIENRVYFNYSDIKEPLSFLTAIAGRLVGDAVSLVANGLKSLVYDESLGAFFKWSANSMNYASWYTPGLGPLLPPSNHAAGFTDKGGVEYDNLPIGEHFRGSLGFFFNRRYGLFTIYEDISVVEDLYDGYLIPVKRPTLLGITGLYQPSTNVVALTDALHEDRLHPFDVQFSIPFETFGDSAIDKSVVTATFFQDSKKIKQDISKLKMTADWDTGGVVNPVSLTGNIRYPVQSSNTHVPRIIKNKLVIPGSGNYLSLSFENEDTLNDKGFSLLGYNLSISMENRP